MKTIRLLMLFAVSLLVGNTASAQWTQVWADEFNTIGPDWVFETGTGSGGWGNNELQYYRRENASIQNGQLVIQARREAFGGMQYTSTRMKTQGRRSWKYGRVEARLSMPSFQGVWPAFWMLGDNITSVGWPACGEIDIMEHVNTGGNVHGTIHWLDHNNSYANYGGSTSTTVTSMHVYAIEWNANAIRWFVDGAQYHVTDITNGINGTHEFHNNHFIILNLAIGGNWPGFTIDNNAFPANMVVDYVRVFQQGGTPPPPPPPTGGVATMYRDCNYGGTAVALPVGNYTLSQMIARGIRNDDISSLRVSAGHEVVLYQHDNFTGTAVTFTGDDACLVDNGINDWASSIRVRTRTTGFATTIQAENYSAMAGVQTEGTTDAGGGLNVGWIDTNDWMAYNGINIPTSGTYRIEYRVASPNSTGRISLDINGGATVLGAVGVPSTGGWQNWTTVSHTVNINAGTYNFGIFAATGGFNLNWWRISSASGARLGGSDDLIAESTRVFPNPALNNLFIQSPEFVGATVKIINAQGGELISGVYSEKGIDVSQLKSGVYSIVLEKNGKRINRRFIKN